MINKLEQEFFKVFGIKKREHAFLFSEPDGSKYYYPKITDRILLELVCIIYQSQDYYVEIDELRQDILENCLKYKDDINKQQVQQLFKGEE